MKDETPAAYSKGWVEFYKLKFKVSPDVLIPRPETELLVDEVLRLKPCVVLDVGTGSGNIAISIAKNLSLHLRGGKLKVVATDVSERALDVARQNAKFHQVEDKIDFVESNLLSNVISSSLSVRARLRADGLNYSEGYILRQHPQNDNFIIVANLPYIPTDRIDHLDSSVKEFEPHLALDGGEDGFGLYRKLFEQMREKNLVPKYLIAEIDYTQGDLAVAVVKEYFPEAEVEVRLDLAHRQRILVVTFVSL